MERDEKTSILLVDDEENILSALQRLLFEYDYHIDATTSPSKALELVEKKDYTIVISDQKMPDMLGAKLLEKVRYLSPDSIRILLTGYSDVDAAVDAINLGAVYRYVKKPWQDDELIMLIQEAVVEHRYGQQKRVVYEMVQHYQDDLMAVLQPENNKDNNADSAEIRLLRQQFNELTSRQKEVLLCIAEGMSNNDISEKLCISLATVKNHVVHIYKKLDVENRTQAAMVAEKVKQSST